MACLTAAHAWNRRLHTRHAHPACATVLMQPVPATRRARPYGHKRAAASQRQHLVDHLLRSPGRSSRARRHRRRASRARPARVESLQVPLGDLARKGGKANTRPLVFQLLIAPSGPLLGACGQEDLEGGLGEDHGAHVAPVGDQARGRGRRRAGAPAGPRAPPARPPPGRRPARPSPVRIAAVTSRPSSSIRSSPVGPAPKSTSMPRGEPRRARAIIGWPSPSCCPARPPGGTARRCRAGASPARAATARLMVPLPEPLGHRW